MLLAELQVCLATRSKGWTDAFRQPKLQNQGRTHFDSLLDLLLGRATIYRSRAKSSLRPFRNPARRVSPIKSLWAVAQHQMQGHVQSAFISRKLFLKLSSRLVMPLFPRRRRRRVMRGIVGNVGQQVVTCSQEGAWMRAPIIRVVRKHHSAYL